MSDDVAATGNDKPKMKLKVHIRLRPLTEENKNGVVVPEHRLMYLNDPSKPGHSSEFVFDRIFDADAKQDDVFDEIGKPAVEHVLNGYNACCFAYGQTGSGKTYSMFGGEGSGRGLIPRAAEHLFEAVEAMQDRSSVRLSIFVSFLEIYLEQVRDLSSIGLAGGTSDKKRSNSFVGSDPTNLEIFEDVNGMTMVKDLTYTQVTQASEVLDLLKAGQALRQVAHTDQNSESSRSHTVFTLTVVNHQNRNQPVTGRLHLVDLAGSERLDKSHSEGARQTETKSINKSLVALGKVVMALSAMHGGDSGTTHIPFRDSKLTRLLKDSLQGNCHTNVLAALNPSPDDFDECFNTLQFAVRCQSISMAPIVNTGGGASSGGAAMDGLVQQVEALKAELEMTHAHYQKLMEHSAGPAWSKDLGPTERNEAQGSFNERGSAGSVVALAREPSRRFSLGCDARGVDGGNQQPQADARGKRLESQLELQREKLSAAEGRLMAKRKEADDFRERMMAKDYSQVNEMKRLKGQLADSKALLDEVQGLSRHKEEEQKRGIDQQLAYLTADNVALRAQLATMSASVTGMMEARGGKALAEKRERDALLANAEARLKDHVARTAAEKGKQVENLKQQSTYHLVRKSGEIGALRDQLANLKEQKELDVKNLKAEAEYLVEYAEKVTEMLRRMEAGTYGVIEKGGLRQFKVPIRDRPGPLQADRLRYIGAAINGVDHLIAATENNVNCRSSTTSTSGAMPYAQSSVYAPGSTGAQSLNNTPRSQSARRPALVPPTAPTGTSSVHAPAPAAGFSEAPGLPALPAELEQLKLQWEALMRETITSQVVADLRSDKTVEYIRSLEGQMGRYRQELQAEKKRSHEMNVALRSVQRVQSRPGSAINRALSGATIPLPPSWGPGHTPASVHYASLRPSSAGAARVVYPAGAPAGASALAGRSAGMAAAPWNLPITSAAGSVAASPSMVSSAGCVSGGYLRENGLSY